MHFHVDTGLGWGATFFSSEQSEFLNQVDVTVNSTDLLKFALETNVGVGGKDPCEGDSGGPLLLREDLEWTLVGTLIGGGFDCLDPPPFGSNDTTSDWSKVAIHVPWIKSLIEEQPGICDRLQQSNVSFLTLKLLLLISRRVPRHEY